MWKCVIYLSGSRFQRQYLFNIIRVVWVCDCPFSGPLYTLGSKLYTRRPLVFSVVGSQLTQVTTQPFTNCWSRCLSKNFSGTKHRKRWKTSHLCGWHRLKFDGDTLVVYDSALLYHCYPKDFGPRPGSHGDWHEVCRAQLLSSKLATRMNRWCELSDHKIASKPETSHYLLLT